MAVAQVTVRTKGNWITATWEAAATGDTFEAIYMNHNVADCWIEGDGTYANGTSIGLTGYVLDPSSTFAMVDPGGTAIALTADSCSPVRDVAPNIVPTIASGSSDSVVVTMYFKVSR